jgi:cytoplasmic iron level regulating protein YaaA (DUF328/UPF0246 family)
MLILLSPAKSLDYQSPLPEVPHTQPLFVKQSAELIALLREKSPQQIASLMGLSDKLAQLNVARYAAWRPRFNASNSRPAVLAFNGNVYGGMDARSLAADELAWLQEHLCILSGLYGVLRPLDWMQPYRLEMGTALENAEGKNLYQFWAAHISKYLNQRLRSELAPVVLNLASQEYFKALDLKALKARVVDCVFEEYRAGRYKVIALHAKRARGLMARHAAQQKALTPQQLQGFDDEGYAYCTAVSGPQRLVFRRGGPVS